MSQPKLSPIETTVANLVERPELQPESVKHLFKKLSELRPIIAQIEQGIAQSNEALNRLYENRARMTGSFEMIMQLIDEAMPRDLIIKYGEKLLKPEVADGNNETRHA